MMGIKEKEWMGEPHKHKGAVVKRNARKSVYGGEDRTLKK